MRRPADQEREPAGEHVLSDDERIDQAGRESFPASDPPSWTLGIERHEQGVTPIEPPPRAPARSRLRRLTDRITALFR